MSAGVFLLVGPELIAVFLRFSFGRRRETLVTGWTGELSVTPAHGGALHVVQDNSIPPSVI